MNNNPNRNRNGERRQGGNQPRVTPVRRSQSSNGRQTNDPRRRPTENSRPRQVHNVPRRPDTRRKMPAKRRSSSLSRLALIWMAVLAVILIVIMMIAGARKEQETVPAGITTAADTQTDIATADVTSDNLLSHAEYTPNTKQFSADLDFTNGILIDVETGEVVAGRNGDARIYPASMMKVMTLIVATENVTDLDETFTMTAEITDPLYQANASVAGFLVGEEVTVRDLIYGLILPSGGDGAMGLAYHIAGSEEAFAELMNAKAKEMGLTKTHFTNCTGLHDDDNYSTCHEVALMIEYAIKDPFMKQVLTTYQYTTEPTAEHPNGIQLTSTMLSRMEGDESETMFIQGGKTGFTNEAKNCLVSFATPLIPGMSEDELKLQPTKYILVTTGSGERHIPVFCAIDIYKEFWTADADITGAAVTADAVGDTVAAVKKPEKTEKTEKPAETVSSSAESSSPVKIYTAKAPSR